MDDPLPQMAGPRARESQGRVVLPVVTGFEKLTYTGNWAGLHSSRAGKAGISSNRSSDQLAGDQRWIEVVHRDQHLQILEGNQVKIPPLTPRTANRRGEDGVQRWHAGAEGSSAQIREGCLSCVRYRVTAKSTRRIAMNDPNIGAEH